MPSVDAELEHLYLTLVLVRGVRKQGISRRAARYNLTSHETGLPDSGVRWPESWSIATPHHLLYYIVLYYVLYCRLSFSRTVIGRS